VLRFDPAGHHTGIVTAADLVTKDNAPSSAMRLTIAHSNEKDPFQFDDGVFSTSVELPLVPEPTTPKALKAMGDILRGSIPYMMGDKSNFAGFRRLRADWNSSDKKHIGDARFV